MKLFDAQTTGGSSAAVDFVEPEGLFSAWGTWGGATVALEYSPDNGVTWINVGIASTFTSNGVAKISIKGGKIRATLSNAGALTSLSAQV